MPDIQFRNGDSVSVSFAESSDDFSYLIGNYPRNAGKFYQFLPDLPPVASIDELKLIPILAVKVTLFLNLGVSIGLTNLHVVGDASTTLRFIKSWASICRSGGDAEFLANKSFHPLHARCLINFPYEKLTKKYWNELKQAGFTATMPPIQAENKVRATFVMRDATIEKLKNLAKTYTEPDSARHVWTYSVSSAYVWSCLAKLEAAIGEENDGMDTFVVAADCMARMDPPLPENYFGNCVGPLFVRSPRAQLIGNFGFLVVEKVIGEAIYERFSCSNEEMMRIAEDWPSELKGVNWATGTAGSPRFDACDADFGWGKPDKFELISIDVDGSMSVCKLGNGLEIGLSLPKIKMDAFASIFNEGLDLQVNGSMLRISGL